jgi:hypothetical protein
MNIIQVSLIGAGGRELPGSSHVRGTFEHVHIFDRLLMKWSREFLAQKDIKLFIP